MVDRAAAEVLFEEARRLMEASRYAEARVKLEESERLDPTSGTLLNLALCHERSGRTASAWLAYNKALTLAIREGNEARQRIGRVRLAELGALVSRLRITSPRDAPQGLFVALDGSRLGPAAWATPIPVDPGSHRIEVGAPGKVTAVLDVEVTLPASQTEVQLPELAPAPRPAPRPSSPAVAADSRGNQARAVWTGAAFGLGAAGIVSGAYLGMRAYSEWEERNAHCSDSGCDAQASAAGDDARALARASNLSFALGALAVGAGTYLVLTAPKQSKVGPTVAIRAAVSPASATLGAEGVF